MLEEQINYDESETKEKSWRTPYSLHFESLLKKSDIFVTKWTKFWWLCNGNDRKGLHWFSGMN